MIFKPAQLGMAKLDKQELVEDRKSCKKIGPCGVGKTRSRSWWAATSSCRLPRA